MTEKVSTDSDRQRTRESREMPSAAPTTGSGSASDANLAGDVERLLSPAANLHNHDTNVSGALRVEVGGMTSIPVDMTHEEFRLSFPYWSPSLSVTDSPPRFSAVTSMPSSTVMSPLIRNVHSLSSKPAEPCNSPVFPTRCGQVDLTHEEFRLRFPDWSPSHSFTDRPSCRSFKSSLPLSPMLSPLPLSILSLSNQSELPCASPVTLATPQFAKQTAAPWNSSSRLQKRCAA